MAVRELVENSFPYDEPILVRTGGRIQLLQIGELVERELLSGDGIVLGDKHYRHLTGDSEVLTLDEDLRLSFRWITAAFKHKSPENLWKVSLGAERAVVTTSAHNIFVLGAGCEVKGKKTSELSVGERIIVPTEGKEFQRLAEISLLEELLRLPDEATERIVVHGLAQFYPQIIPQTQRLLAVAGDRGTVTWNELASSGGSKDSRRKTNDLIQTLRKEGFLRTISKGTYMVNAEKSFRRHHGINRDWVRLDFVPFNYFRRNMPPTFDPAKLAFSVKQGRSHLPSTLTVTPALLRLMGYYSSEGSIHAHHKITLSFGTHETETLVKDAVRCLEEVFGIRPFLTPQHESAINVVVNDSTLAFLFEMILGMGTRSENKRVSWLAFNVRRELAESYLDAYTRGDGYRQMTKGNRKTVLVTSSERLFTDLKFLLTMLGFHFSAGSVKGGERMVKGVRTVFRKSYCLYIRLGQAPPSESIPISEIRSRLTKLTKKTNPYNEYAQKNWILRNLDLRALPHSVAKFVESDAGSLEIKGISQVPRSSEWVYDISVEGVERFIGGHAVALLHNSMDAAEMAGALPEVYVRIISEGANPDLPDPKPYRLTVIDNGPGVAPQHVPSAFGKVFYGSKYVLRQSRGMFGLGGTMAILYGQITTNRPVVVTTSADGKKKHAFQMTIDIGENRPTVLKRFSSEANGTTGTRVDLTLEGDYLRASQKIADYFKQTALVASYANLTFVDPLGQITFYERATTSMPPAPKETLPHPYGIDVEAFKRIIKVSDEHDMKSFMVTHFHRVGEKIATRFLEFAGISPNLPPKRLNSGQVVAIVDALQRFPDFLQPDATVLSPVGEEILLAGMNKELQPEFSTVVTRPPSSYSGFPFLVEVGVAYGGKVLQPGVKLFRFANRIPLLYDESSDVSFEVLNEEVDWRRYHVPPEAPVGVITHICSTRIPYKTVGKEYIADRPEIQREIRNAAREALRQLGIFLSRKGSMEAVQRKMNIYGKYLPLIARFATELSGAKRLPKYQGMVSEGDSAEEESSQEAETEMGESQEPVVDPQESEIEQKKIDEYRGS